MFLLLCQKIHSFQNQINIFLIYLPLSDEYLQFVPQDFQEFYNQILPYLSARTTDVHTAVCMQYLDEFIAQAEALGHKVNRNVLAYALMLHDSGWSQMTKQEIASSLGVKGLALTETALASKEKHAVFGEQIVRKILKAKQMEFGLTDLEIELICKAILYHDKPEAVAGSENKMPMEVQLLVDLDHVWSFTHLNFWQNTLLKGVDPKKYLENLRADLDSYFVTDIGKNKAKELLAQREKEVQDVT